MSQNSSGGFQIAKRRSSDWVVECDRQEFSSMIHPTVSVCVCVVYACPGNLKASSAGHAYWTPQPGHSSLETPLSEHLPCFGKTYAEYSRYTFLALGSLLLLRVGGRNEPCFPSNFFLGPLLHFTSYFSFFTSHQKFFLTECPYTHATHHHPYTQVRLNLYS